MNILVTGGTGYIGSHTCVELLEAGHRVVIVDNLSNSRPEIIDLIRLITGTAPILYVADVCDKDAMRRIFAKEQPNAVIHFAGYKVVSESCSKPLAYYRNNLDSSLTLLEVMAEFGCKRLVFSSSAAVYGMNNASPYDETMPALTASNPYGQTKIMIERIICDYAAADPEFSAVLLRYFNPIGAHCSGLLGDDPAGIPNNLMPYVVRVAAGQLETLTVFGGDYPTPDGTCLRDYIHVVDLAKGHLCAIDYTIHHTGAEAVNLGTGQGTSVLELVHTFEAATGVPVAHAIGPRREGDLPACWADPAKAEALLGWKAELGIKEMCRDSWGFVQKQND